MQMNMSGFISLPQNKIHKKEETKKLNLPSNFVESFYKDFLDGVDFSQYNDFHSSLLITPWAKQPAIFVKKYKGSWTCT